jgi:hypothetical protein
LRVDREVAFLEPLVDTRTEDFDESVPDIPLFETQLTQIMKELTTPNDHGRSSAP